MIVPIIQEARNTTTRTLRNRHFRSRYTKAHILIVGKEGLLGYIYRIQTIIKSTTYRYI